MLSLRSPTSETIGAFLSAQAKLDFTYSAVGATAALPRRATGSTTHGSGWAKVRRFFPRRRPPWNMGPVPPRLGGSVGPGEPIRTGAVVAVIARLLGLWWLNACRIVYVVDEPVPVRRFGFAFGTLPAQPETGEERFLIEWDAASGTVWYDILAFSRPHEFLARLGYPYTRRVQKRFRRDSAQQGWSAVRYAATGDPNRAYLKPRQDQACRLMRSAKPTSGQLARKRIEPGGVKARGGRYPF